MNKIPFSPPFVDEDVIAEVTNVLKSGWITTGLKTKELEEAIATYCNVEAVLGVNSATSGLMLVLHWLGVKRGDEVIVPAYTYCATALAVMHVGATPVMADVLDDFTIDTEAIKKLITQKTKAIITVDFAGWPCDYDAIYEAVNDDEIKKQFTAEGEVQQMLGRICVIDDAAHSLGAIYKNKKIGSVADITVFSFHAVKNVTTAEGGAICFNMPAPFDNKQLYTTLKLWSLNGQTKDALSKTVYGGWKYDIIYPGFKINLPDVLAAIGLAQFKKYEDYLLPERKRVFEFYNSTFKNYSWFIEPPFNKSNCISSYHVYPLRINGIDEAKRDIIIEEISSNHVSVNVHFTPLPMLTVFKEQGYCIDKFPTAYKNYASEISLPVYSQLSQADCSIVTKTVIDAVQKHF